MNPPQLDRPSSSGGVMTKNRESKGMRLTSSPSFILLDAPRHSVHSPNRSWIQSRSWVAELGCRWMSAVSLYSVWMNRGHTLRIRPDPNHGDQGSNPCRSQGFVPRVCFGCGSLGQVFSPHHGTGGLRGSQVTSPFYLVRWSSSAEVAVGVSH